jgi:hypothetical protein
MPVQGSAVAAVNGGITFSVTFTDLNADLLHERWIVEYPMYKPGISHLLQSDREWARPANGQPVDITDNMVNVSCLNGLALTDQHDVTVFISDQPFWNAADPDAPTDSPELMLTQNSANSVMAQANWHLNLPCH